MRGDHDQLKGSWSHRWGRGGRKERNPLIRTASTKVNQPAKLPALPKLAFDDSEDQPSEKKPLLSSPAIFPTLNPSDKRARSRFRTESFDGGYGSDGERMGVFSGGSRAGCVGDS